MRILLDEDIPHRLRLQFPPGHEVETVEYRGWKGLKNGALLRSADPHFDALLALHVLENNELPRVNQRTLRSKSARAMSTFGRAKQTIHPRRD